MFIVANLSKYAPVIAGVVVVCAIILYVYYRGHRKRRLQKQFDELEISYNEMMSIPVLFKLNKSVSITKINPDVIDAVDGCKREYEDVSAIQSDIATILADVEDAIAFGKLKDAALYLDDAITLIDDGLEKTRALDANLESLLEQETRQRHEINELKDSFRKIKQTLAQNQHVYQESYECLEKEVTSVEQLFSTFEEWMYATDFEKAQSITNQIVDALGMLDTAVTSVPTYYQTAQVTLPSLLDGVGVVYQDVVSHKVYIDHLEVPKNLSMISDVIKEDLKAIHQIKLDGLEESLQSSTKRLEQLKHEMDKELKATLELEKQFQSTVVQFEKYQEAYQEIVEEKDTINDRYHLTDFMSDLDRYSKEVETLKQGQTRLEEMRHVEKLPATTVLISFNEWSQDLSHSMQDFIGLRDTVNQARGDELRAKQQLLKLHLIINDVQVRIKKRALPKISEQYDEDIKKAIVLTNGLKQALDVSQLNIDLLNARVDEAIDYIYKLHNNVNNLVGVVDMCENAFVYANKYRAYHEDIDHELTRAELSFNAGEYTKSLKTILAAIERYKPGVEYEEMIRDNAKSAR